MTEHVFDELGDVPRVRFRADRDVVAAVFGEPRRQLERRVLPEYGFETLVLVVAAIERDSPVPENHGVISGFDHEATVARTLRRDGVDEESLSVHRGRRPSHTGGSRSTPKYRGVPARAHLESFTPTRQGRTDMDNPHILLLGAPGAGKGTQSSRLVEEYGLDHITTGDALRANKDVETEYGTPREYMEAGELVPDPVVNEIVAAALDDADGFILDGYPRNLAQAETLASYTDLDYVIYLEVADDVLVDRLTGRRVCSECGTNFHVEFNPPATDGVCDECGGELVQREDDTEETVRERLRVFEENTEPVVEFYDDRGVLVRVDGEGTPDEVFDAITAVIEP